MGSIRISGTAKERGLSKLSTVPCRISRSFWKSLLPNQPNRHPKNSVHRKSTLKSFTSQIQPVPDHFYHPNRSTSTALVQPIVRTSHSRNNYSKTNFILQRKSKVCLQKVTDSNLDPITKKSRQKYKTTLCRGSRNCSKRKPISGPRELKTNNPKDYFASCKVPLTKIGKPISKKMMSNPVINHTSTPSPKKQ